MKKVLVIGLVLFILLSGISVNTVEGQLLVGITKKAEPEALIQGEQLTITVKVENNGIREFFNVKVTDTVPARFELISGSTSIDRSSLKPGESITMEYVLKALEAGDFIFGSATVTYEGRFGVHYSKTSNIIEVHVPYNNPPSTPSRPSGSSSGYAGITYTYSTSATDPDGDKVQYSFDWGDGTVSSWTSSVYSGNSASKSHSWSSPGTYYYVRAQAKDSHGAISSWSSSKTVTITAPHNSPPNTPSRPSGSSSGYAGITYTYSTSATDPDGDKVQYSFDWGDGTVSSWTSSVYSGNSASKSHSWSSPGTYYYVRAQAKDSHGAISSWSSSKTVTITAPHNSPPNTPSRPSGSSSGYAGITYTYSTSATDPDGDKVQYSFDWGDGTVSSWTSSVYSGNSASKSHSWSSPGTYYYVRAQAKDSHGAISSWSSSKTVTITAPHNSPPNTPSRPSGSSSGYAGITYTYSTSATDPDGDKVQYSFDWGDGTVSSWTSSVYSGNSASKSHSWSSPGTYYIRVQAKDSHGAISSGSSSKTVTITTPSSVSSSDWLAIRVNIQDFDYTFPSRLPKGELRERWFIKGYVTNRDGIKIAETRSPIYWLSDKSEHWIDLVIRKNIPKRGERVTITLEAFTWLGGRYIDINPDEPNIGKLWENLPYEGKGRRLDIPYTMGEVEDDRGNGGTCFLGIFGCVLTDIDGRLYYKIETLEPSDQKAIRVNILDFDYTMPTGGIPGPVCSRWTMNGYVTNEEGVKIAERRSPVHLLSDKSEYWVDLVIRKDTPKRGDTVDITLEPRTYALLNCLDIDPAETNCVKVAPPLGFPPWDSPRFQGPFGPFNSEGRSNTTSYTVGTEKKGWGNGSKDISHCPMDLDGELHYKIETLDPSNWITIRVSILDFDYTMPTGRRSGPLYSRWYMNGYVTNEEGMRIGRARSTLFWLSDESECWVDLVFRKDIPVRGDSVSITLEPRTWATGNYIDINASEPEPVPFPTYNPKGRRLTIPYIVGTEKDDWGIGGTGLLSSVLIDFDGKLHYKIETLGLTGHVSFCK